MKDQNKYLLVIHYTSDEIHFNVMDYIHYDRLVELQDELLVHYNGTDLVDLILENSIDSLMCQSGVIEDYSIIQQYNIVNVVHITEMGF